jgi:hypothetical protein
MPFAGDAAAARAAVATLRGMSTGPGDELILADNCGAVGELAGITVLRAAGERSPAHARNAGARVARGEWILFLDADCLAPATLLEDYFASPVDEDVGALAGEVRPAPGPSTLAGRYGAARSFLGQQAHLAHPYLPRAAAANLLVRAEAFRGIGGFLEGVRAAEDTDFSWRLQRAGWRLELCRRAQVMHTYRTSVRELRRQWRGYAAGRAWLSRRYDGFIPEPAARRLVARRSRRSAPVGVSAAPTPAAGPPPPRPSRLERGRYLALDAVLALDELAGLTLSNRPAGAEPPGPAQVVLVAERFPVAGDPFVDLARALEHAQVEAASRPELIEAGLLDGLRVAYREDDGVLTRWSGLMRLAVRHPGRCLHDVLRRRLGGHDDAPSLAALAPAARRIERESPGRVQALGEGPRRVAARLAALAGTRYGDGAA